MPLCSGLLRADNLDALENRLRQNQQIQEKVYVHTDNSCYFIGDTIWYKAYVVRADNLHPTDMSKMLYVELLAPDGVVVDRQRVVVSDKNYTCCPQRQSVQWLLRDTRLHPLDAQFQRQVTSLYPRRSRLVLQLPDGRRLLPRLGRPVQSCGSRV